MTLEAYFIEELKETKEKLSAEQKKVEHIQEKNIRLLKTLEILEKHAKLKGGMVSIYVTVYDGKMEFENIIKYFNLVEEEEANGK